MDEFYRRVIELGLERLGFERLAIFRYDETDGAALGTFGTDPQGYIVDERRLGLTSDPNGMMPRPFERVERFHFDANVPLYSNMEPVGTGWNATAVLWDGTQSLGWLVADNLLSHKPAPESLLELLSLYALALGTLLARKQTNAALLESQQMLQTVLETIPVQVFWKDRDSVYLGGNHLVTEWGGLDSAEALIGKTDLELPWRDQADLFMTDDQTVIQTGVPITHPELLMTNSVGTRRWVQTSKIPLRDSTGEIIGVIGANIDITPRKQAEEELERALEQQKELVDLKSRFIAMASHDFRTPMSVILSSLSILELQIGKLLGTDQVEPLQKRFRRIEDSVRQMVSLLDDVLAVNRTDTGKVEIHAEPLDVVSLCQEILQEVRLSASERHVLEFSHTGEDHPVLSDRQLVRQILVNLLSNAVKYSPDGGNVLLDVHRESRIIEIRVKDEGIGIPEQDQALLFEAFHRAHNVGRIQGTGLGMAIVKRAVDALGGTIAFESQVGVGTTFVVHLPAVFRAGGSSA